MEVVITKENFEALKNGNLPLVVDFWAEWCGPCMMLSPLVDEVAEEMDDIKVCKINRDEAREIALQYGIMSIPTLLVFQQGEVVNQSVGLIDKQDIINLVK